MVSKLKYALVASLLMAQPASAALMDGQTITVSQVSPSTDSVTWEQTAVVGEGVEATYSFINTIDVSDTRIVFDFLVGGWWGNTEFNGFWFFDINDMIGDFTAVTIDPATNMAGLDASRITFDANNIYINFQNLSFTADTIVSLSINGGASNPVPTPEPAALGLLGVGLLAAAGLRRRKAK